MPIPDPSAASAAVGGMPPAVDIPSRVRIRRIVRRLLEAIVLTLMAALAAVVVLGVIFRKLDAALVWYDEVASILLAWLTYYGAALAALQRAHIGVPNLVTRLSGGPRFGLILVAEACVIGFFLIVAWSGWTVMTVLGGSSLVSLPSVPLWIAQSVIPVGAVLFILGELLSLPDVLSGVADPPPVGSAAGSEEPL